jgi:hypothetical protein
MWKLLLNKATDDQTRRRIATATTRIRDVVAKRDAAFLEFANRRKLPSWDGLSGEDVEKELRASLLSAFDEIPAAQSELQTVLKKVVIDAVDNLSKYQVDQAKSYVREAVARIRSVTKALGTVTQNLESLERLLNKVTP